MNPCHLVQNISVPLRQTSIRPEYFYIVLYFPPHVHSEWISIKQTPFNKQHSEAD